MPSPLHKSYYLILKTVLKLIAFYRWGNKSSERQSKVDKALHKERLRFRLSCVWLWNLQLNIFTIFRYSKMYYVPLFLVGFPRDSVVRNLPANAGDTGDAGSIPGSGRSPGGGHGNPLQYSCLKNPQGQRSLVGYSPWSCRELDTTELLTCYYMETTANILCSITNMEGCNRK